MDTRTENIASIIVGRKHTGKSTMLATIATNYSKYGRVLIFDVNGSPAYNKWPACKVEQLKHWKSGNVAKIVGTPTQSELITVAKDFRNGLAIFEDCTKYIKGNVKPEILAFLVDHRMMGCDLIFTFHSLKRVPPQFWEMISYITLLKTQETFDAATYKNKVPNYEKIADAFEKVKASPDNYFSITVETLV